MAPVTVTLHGTLNRILGDSPADRERTRQIHLQEQSTARQLLGELRLPIDLLSLLLVNGERADLDTSVADGDRIEVFPYCGGG